MKLLMYTNVLSGGGAERVLSNLANFFAGKGYEIVMVNSFPTEKEYFLNDKIKHVYLEQVELRKSFLNRNISRIRKLRTLLKKEKPDVAIAFMSESNFRLVAASHFLQVKTLVSVRNDPVKENENRIVRCISNYTLKHANAVVFQTKDAQEYFGESIKEHSKIILNPVKNEIYDLEFEGKRKNIVTAGRLSPQKNHMMLIEAFSKIAEDTEENLLIYGEGNDRELLQNKIRELKMEKRIFLMGNSANLHEEIKSAKLFVMSSDYEGLPNALMEAMALGIPSISTDCPCGGPKMLIENGKNGYLVPVRDVNLFAEKMKEVLLLPDEERQMIGTRAKESAQAFKAEVVCREWEIYIKSL